MKTITKTILAPVLGMALLTAPFAAAQQGATTAAASASYDTTNTDIGTILDDPAAKAVLQKHLPALVASPQFEMARGITLKALQGYAPDAVKDEQLAAVDADLAKLKRTAK